MKKLFIIVFTLCLVNQSLSVQAQEGPYKNSIGGIAGSLSGFSYKGFVSKHCALQLDFGAKITGISSFTYYPDLESDAVVGHYTNRNLAPLETIEANFSVMFEGKVAKGFHLFIGGGVSLGMSYNNPIGNAFLDMSYYNEYNYRNSYTYPQCLYRYNEYITGKVGFHNIAGLEYSFNIPLTIQLDARPGSALLFETIDDGVCLYLDWSVQLSVRYAIKNK